MHFSGEFIKKKFISLIFMITIPLSLTGCMGSIKIPKFTKINGSAVKILHGTEEEAKLWTDTVLEYLNSNYTDTFTPKTFNKSSWYDWEFDMTFTSARFPDDVIEVNIDNGSNSLRITENYYRYLMMDDAVKYGESIMQNKVASVKAHFHDEIWSDDLEGAKTFAEWNNKGTVVVDYHFITREPLTEKEQYDIVNKLAADKVGGCVHFYSTNDSELLKDLTVEDLDKVGWDIREGKGSEYANSFAIYHIDYEDLTVERYYPK